MTIFGTPAGTTLNYTGFQGTQPGNPVQATLSPVIPGVGLFPPNSNNNSGDSIMASISRAATPANVNMTNFGISGSGNKCVLGSLGGAGTRGTGPGFVQNGGSQNDGPSGTGSATNAAGGMSQGNAAPTGEVSILPSNAPSTIPTIPVNPSFRG